MKSASTINTLDISSKPMSVLKHLCNDIKIKNLFSIQPHFDSFQKRIVLILFLEIDNGGFLSGGACGEKDDYNSVFERAFVELIRHLLGYKRMLKSNLKPTTFYDKRIFFFASGAGRSLVHERIYSTNASIVHLPKIKYDSILGHKLQKIAVVYHFQFENPPLFLEGPLERLCI